jgi:FMN phosphatase YigB (HAD superfamily)
MVKLKDLLLEKKLRVFDFDDTLVKSNSKVFLVRNGKRKEMTPGEFAIYKKSLAMSLTFLSLTE